MLCIVVVTSFGALAECRLHKNGKHFFFLSMVRCQVQVVFSWQVSLVPGCVPGRGDERNTYAKEF